MISDNKIDKLITKFRSGEALPEEAMRLEDWIDKSPENKSYFNDHSKIFDVASDITFHDRSRAWKNISDVIDKEESSPKSKMINRRLINIAASIVLILAIGLVANNYNKKETGSLIYRSEASSKKILLEDNSEIMMLPNSSIVIDKEYGARNRDIKLNGSATFSVVHNPLQALIVDVSTFHIKDIGTIFSVVTSPASDTIFIKVTEGKIAVYDDFGSSDNASAGESVLYIKSQKKLQVFRIKNNLIITRAEHGERSAVPSKIISAKKVNVAALADTAIQNNNPCVEQLADQGYVAKKRYDRKTVDSTRDARVVTDLALDSLIVRGEPLVFTLSDTAFILNGKKQSDAVFKRYLKKYGGKNVGPWSWGHAENQPSKH